MINKVCVYCKKEFVAKNKNSKYCCTSCRGKYKYNSYKNHIHTCKNCGLRFKHHRKDIEYCSKKCASKKRIININDIISFIKNNNQATILEVKRNFKTSLRSIYNILKDNGYDSYVEVVKHVKGSYNNASRQDSSISAERCVKIIAELLNDNYVSEKKFKDCTNPITGKQLRFDYFFENQNLIVEYNGIQHYKYNPLFHKNIEDLEYQKYKDKIKIDYCIYNNIKLLIINYKDILDNENISKKINKLMSISSRAIDTSIEGSEASGEVKSS